MKMVIYCKQPLFNIEKTLMIHYQNYNLAYVLDIKCLSFQEVLPEIIFLRENNSRIISNTIEKIELKF